MRNAFERHIGEIDGKTERKGLEVQPSLVTMKRTHMALAQTTVGVVEPVALFRDAIAGFIDSQPGLRVEFAVASERELVSACAPSTDVLLLGAALTRTTFSPQDMLEQWQTLLPGNNIILMTDCQARKAITAFLRCGLRGYVIREGLTMPELIEAIHVVADGSIKLCHQARQILFGPELCNVNLTHRELEVIWALPRLRTTKRVIVARELGMSPANLNNYISEIAQKLDVFGADGIIDRAFELGILAVIDKKENTPAVRNELEMAATTVDEEDTSHQTDPPTESSSETSE
jgi:DNA-binding NarL/FixJ family response regulator